MSRNSHENMDSRVGMIINYLSEETASMKVVIRNCKERGIDPKKIRKMEKVRDGLCRVLQFTLKEFELEEYEDENSQN